MRSSTAILGFLPFYVVAMIIFAFSGQILFGRSDDYWLVTTDNVLICWYRILFGVQSFKPKLLLELLYRARARALSLARARALSLSDAN